MNVVKSRECWPERPITFTIELDDGRTLNLVASPTRDEDREAIQQIVNRLRVRDFTPDGVCRDELVGIKIGKALRMQLAFLSADETASISLGFGDAKGDAYSAVSCSSSCMVSLKSRVTSQPYSVKGEQTVEVSAVVPHCPGEEDRDA